MGKPNESSESELLERARAGDAPALEALLAREQDRVYRFGMRMCRNPEDAEDVLQETLLAMARGIRDFQGASSLSTWLYTIARSHCIKKRRRSKFAPTSHESIDAEAAGPATNVVDTASPPDARVDEKRIARAVEEAIASLDPKYREVLLLRDVEGLSAPEVAEILAMNVAAVKTRLHRARLVVRERVAPLFDRIPEAAPASASATATEPCPDIVPLFSRHLEGEIDHATCARMEKHIATCPRCSARCDSLRRTLAFCRSSADGTHVPSEVQASVRQSIRRLVESRA